MFECLNSGQYDRMRNFFGKKLVYIYLHNRRLKELLPKLTQIIKEWNGKDYIIKLKLRHTFQTIPLQHTLLFKLSEVKAMQHCPLTSLARKILFN